MADPIDPGSVSPGPGTGAPQAPTEASATSNAGTPQQPKPDEPSRFDAGREQGKKDLLRELTRRSGGRVKSLEDLDALLHPPEPEPEPAPDPAKPAPPDLTKLQKELDKAATVARDREKERDGARTENDALRNMIVRSQIRLAAKDIAHEHALDDFESFLADRVTVDLEKDKQGRQHAVITIRNADGEATDQSLAQLVESVRAAKPHWCKPLATPGAGSRPGGKPTATAGAPNGGHNLRTTAGLAAMLTDALSQPRR